MNTIPVTVVINSDELRTWADKHADAGHHGVAHVLYQAAKGVESVSEQAIREAKAKAWDEGHGTSCDGVTSTLDGCERHNPYRKEEQ